MNAINPPRNPETWPSLDEWLESDEGQQWLNGAEEPYLATADYGYSWER